MSNKKPSPGPYCFDPPRKHNKDAGLKSARDGTAWVGEFLRGQVLGRSHQWTPPPKGMCEERASTETSDGGVSSVISDHHT